VDRRAFIAGTVGLLAAPLAAEAQQPTKVYRIGFLGAESAAYDASRLEILRTELRKVGYVEGRNLIIESRLAEGNYARLPVFAAELAGLKVDVLVASGAKAGAAAGRATATIPIVVSNMGDAIAPGFVVSYAHPGGNITGMSRLGPEVAAKQVELLRQVKPRSATIAVLINPANPNSGWQAMKREGDAMKVVLEPIEIRGPNEFESAFSTMARRGIDVLRVQGDTMFVAHATAIAGLAVKHRIASAGTPDFARAGGLMGYEANRLEAWRRLSGYVDKILKGAKPADLPVEQPTKFELVINLKTARALGLTIPPSVLARADEVIK
jgi:putative ABC transport system substrate-binding protein